MSPSPRPAAWGAPPHWPLCAARRNGSAASGPWCRSPCRWRPAQPCRFWEHRIQAADGRIARGQAPVWCEGAQIFVSGRAEHAARRLTDYFKREAKKEFEESALAFGAQLGVKPSRITVRDTASRWGSCSSARSLSFSWRLIFAPDFVRDYVVAHEAAHLKEMNHGPRFWAHVDTLTPHARRARKWLRENGRGLLRYN